MQDSFPKSDLMQECVERVNLPKRLCGRIAETDMETHRKMHFHSNGFSATRLRDSELQGTTGYERYLPVLRLRNKYYKTCICRFLLQRPIRIWSNCFNYFVIWNWHISTNSFKFDFRSYFGIRTGNYVRNESITFIFCKSIGSFVGRICV